MVCSFSLVLVLIVSSKWALSVLDKQLSTNTLLLFVRPVLASILKVVLSLERQFSRVPKFITVEILINTVDPIRLSMNMPGYV